MQSALHLVEACEDHNRQLGEHVRNQDTLIAYYLSNPREADRLQREFEQAVSACLDLDLMDEMIEQVRGRYRGLAEKVQLAFSKHLETAGWPPTGRLANADVFDRLVAPVLKESGRKVAFILVDALRYELGLALQQQLSEDEAVELEAGFAQLPSITLVGMASLLPGAGSDLRLARKDDGFVPMLGETVVGNVNQRMDVLRKRYGDRFGEMVLNDYVRSRKALPLAIDLLVLRSVEIDSHLESNADTTLGLIHGTLKRLRRAINKLKVAGFHHVVIASDHGFFLNAQAEAGDVCAKPAGNWINVHDRSLLGDGPEDAHNFSLPAEKIGIRGDFSRLAGPRSMAPYRRGLLYFHGGASLQELVVPVLSIRLQTKQPEVAEAVVSLSYRNGAKRITTRLPVVDVLMESGNMFAQDRDFEILLEAHDRKGQVVGEAKAGGPVNPATGTINLRPGQRIQVTIKMQPEFEGKFTLKALNPTTFGAYCSLNLETDYVV